LSHWFHSEQRGHWFGYWYGHDMFTPPFAGPDGKLTYDPVLREQALKGTNAAMIFPEMARDSVVYGGTDPGRFCPTYMIFCESYIPHRCQPEQDRNFDRRDCYLITQNAVADPTYLDYIRAQYNRSTQYDPPFFQMLLPTEFPKQFQEPTAAVAWLDNIFESIGAKIEWRRRTGTSWFREDQFKDAGKLAARLRPGEAQDELSKYLYGKLGQETQGLVRGQADSRTLARALTRDFNRILTNTADGPTIYSPERFQNIPLPPLIAKAAKDGAGQTPSTRVRLNRRMLEEAYPEAIVKSLGGVYPDTEIQEPNPDDSNQVYADFRADSQRRVEHDMKFPKEPKQVRGDEVVVTEGGMMQVTGQGAVMKINGMLTQMIFDRNPDHEFYVEESFPLDWMYPHLTPFGIIMKINRQPVPEITGEMIARDHQFWSDYSERLTGNRITYDTPVKEICDFCEKVYVTHDYSGFQGDPKFLRDEDAQKSFSKLRNAIGSSIYQWRAGLLPSSPPPPPASDAVKARMAKEAEFALKQSFAYCPFSPETVYHLMFMFFNQHRLEDVRLILATAQKLDPHNGQFADWLANVENGIAREETMTAQSRFNQAQQLVQAGKTAEAEALLDAAAQDPRASLNTLSLAAMGYAGVGKPGKGAAVMQKLTAANPEDWTLWFYLAQLQAVDGKAAEAAAALGRAFALNSSDRVTNQNQPPANFHDLVRQDKSFDRIRQTPEYQKAMGVKN
jgi:hypothetical protein